MSKQWARQEAHKNELALAVEKTWTWTQSNRQRVTVGLGIFLVLLLLGGFFGYQHWANEKAAWIELRRAQYAGAQGQYDVAITQLETINTQFPQTPAWGYGVLLEGDILYRQGLYQRASQSYQRIIDRHAPEALVPFAMTDLGLSQEAARDFAKAIETDRRFLDSFKDHFLAPQTHAALARCLEALGRKEEAKAAYQQMGTLYPDDVYWIQWAQSRLKPTP
jgi:tetratricopeptide (TPR) repeat protein